MFIPIFLNSTPKFIHCSKKALSIFVKYDNLRRKMGSLRATYDA